MIDHVMGNKALPESTRQDIIERTDGIPLFVEEMTKAALEAEGEAAAKRTAATIPRPSIGVPASLHASLMARLDRLGAAKEVAQIGAAMGREFSHALLEAVVGKPEAELQLALEGLVTAGLLFRQGMPPQVSYLFIERGDVWSPDPRRLEFRSVRDNQQHLQGFSRSTVRPSTSRLVGSIQCASSKIISTGLGSRQRLQLRRECFQRLLSPLLWGQFERRIASIVWQR